MMMMVVTVMKTTHWTLIATCCFQPALPLVQIDFHFTAEWPPGRQRREKYRATWIDCWQGAVKWVESTVAWSPGSCCRLDGGGDGPCLCLDATTWTAPAGYKAQWSSLGQRSVHSNGAKSTGQLRQPHQIRVEYEKLCSSDRLCLDEQQRLAVADLYTSPLNLLPLEFIDFLLGFKVQRDYFYTQ